MNCCICDQDNWHYRKDLNPEKEVGICKNCGNVFFKIDDGEEEQVKNFYRKSYRKEPGHTNIITTTHKLNYIKLFITDWLKDKKNLVVADIGAATGYLLNWFKTQGHRVTGTELTLTFRRFSEHYYGIPLTEELTEKHKYDLIVFYHTLEHMIAPDKKLMHHRKLLSDDGCMLISVPEWFYLVENLAALGPLSVDNYFHKNHVYCCSRQSFKNLLAKCGLEIVKENYNTYGMTVLVRKLKPGEVGKAKTPEQVGKSPFVKEDWQKVNSDIDKIKKAIELFQKNKLKEAIDVWYKFPDAHLRLIFDIYKKDPERQKYELDIIVKDMGEIKKVMIGYATWLYQNQRYEEALQNFEKAVNVAPHEDILIFMGWCFERLGRYREAINMFNLAQLMNPVKWSECINWVCKCSCAMPAWDERATEEVKEQLLKKAQPKIELKEVLIGGNKKQCQDKKVIKAEE